jgi:hypothetical protein
VPRQGSALLIRPCVESHHKMTVDGVTVYSRHVRRSRQPRGILRHTEAEAPPRPFPNLKRLDERISRIAADHLRRNASESGNWRRPVRRRDGTPRVRLAAATGSPPPMSRRRRTIAAMSLFPLPEGRVYRLRPLLAASQWQQIASTARGFFRRHHNFGSPVDDFGNLSPTMKSREVSAKEE